ncbi:alpha/beta hydrolase [Candidatus Chlorohelix sp.]|uniref:alpha/beta fold hydrolase n=1 Tax=Candidatus Chlorohelix sp. TaxID=3139201 RepID=UPI0030590C71
MPYAPLRDLKIYYELNGAEEAEPLLLLNGAFGLIDFSSDWGKHFEVFARHYRLIAYEHRGHGRTDNPSQKFSGYSELADDAAGLLKYLGIKKAHVVGFSDGGITALKLAALYPDLVDTLAAIGVNYRNTPEILATMQKLSGDYIEQNFKEWAATLERQYAHREPGYWKKLSTQMTAMWLDDSGYPTEVEMRAMKLPALLMTGQRDPFGTVEQVVEMHRFIEGSELCILPGVAHAVPQQRPELTSLIVLDFLERQRKKRIRETYRP